MPCWLLLSTWKPHQSAIITNDLNNPQVAELPRDLSTFSCTTPRLMPLASIDPSLAIGLYCASADDLEDLCGRLRNMASRSGNTPLLTVDAESGGAGSGAREAAAAASVDRGGGEGVEGGADDWEML